VREWVVKMANRPPIDQLNDAVEAIIADSGARTPADASLAELVTIAADLRGLPDEGFKTRLRAELLESTGAAHTSRIAEEDQQTRREAMTTSATQAPMPVSAVTAYLCCRNAAAAIDFYKRAFGARETMRLTEPGGRIGHAQMLIGNTMVMLGDEYPEYGIKGPESLGGSPVRMHLYVDDVDAVAAQAVEAGARLISPIADQFYGDRSGRLADPFGHLWILATHVEDVTAEEMQHRLDAMVAESAPEIKPIPEGFHTVTPYLQVDGAARLIEFLQDAFGADQIRKVPMPDGTIMHAELRVGDSMIELGDAGGQHKAMPASIHLYVDDADAVYERAVRAGGVSVHEPVDQFYGDREAAVRDPVGNDWYIATHKLADSPIPPGFRSITPFFHPRGAEKFIDFLQKAFTAELAGKHAGADGSVMHAEVRIGDSMIEMGEAHGQWGPKPSAIHLYVEDADAIYKQALEAGAESFFAPRDEPYGDRVGGVTDPFDNVWYIATHVKDVAFPEPPGQDAEKAEKAGVKPIREGFHTVTPYLVLEEAEDLIAFCKEAFGAVETERGTGSAGGTHYEIRIGDSMVMIGGARGMERKFPSMIYLYVEDVDAVYDRAVKAGASVIGPPTDQPYGDRNAGVRDPFGNEWYIATHIKDVG
jgi:PhnB protein